MSHAGGAPAGFTQFQLPVFCRQCGGAVTPAADFSLRCPFCGAVDRLPAAELDRALELRRRLEEAARGVAQVDGMQLALARVFEDRRALWRVGAPWLGLAAVIAVYQAITAWPAIMAAPPSLRLGMWIYASLGTIQLGGIGTGFVVALLVGCRFYRARLRPALYARVPRAPGAPARCRGCGADLDADERGPFLRCVFCHTYNLVTPELAADRDRLLAAEARGHRRQAVRASDDTARAGRRMTQVMVASLVGSYLAVVGVAHLASRLISRGP